MYQTSFSTIKPLPRCYRRLLDYLVENKNLVITHDDIGKIDPVLHDKDNVRVYISKIRKVLEDGEIVTIRGKGYMYKTQESGQSMLKTTLEEK